MNNDTKEAFALNLILCRTVKEAAQKSGISISTANRIRKQEAFQSCLSDLKAKMFTDTMRRAQALSMDALDALQDIMNDRACTDSSRVAAARFILEFGMEACTKEQIIDEIQRLKEAVGGGEN